MGGNRCKLTKHCSTRRPEGGRLGSQGHQTTETRRIAILNKSQGWHADFTTLNFLDDLKDRVSLVTFKNKIQIIDFLNRWQSIIQDVLNNELDQFYENLCKYNKRKSGVS